MPGRNQQGDYRYVYQACPKTSVGQEKDPETGWEARLFADRVTFI